MIDVSFWKVLIARLKVMHGQDDLPQIVHALRTPGSLPRRLHGRKHTHEHGCDSRHQETEEEDARVDADRVAPGDRGRKQGEEPG